MLKIYSCILILGGDKGTDAHTDSTQTNSRPRFHQHQINSVWSPLHEHRTLISTSKPEWESSGGWNSQGELKGSHRLYWAFYLIFNVYPPFHIMASFLSDTSLSFPLWNFFYVYFSIFFFILLCIFSIDLSAAALHATHTASVIKSTQSWGFARSTCLMHFIILSGIERSILIFIYLLQGQSVRFHLQLFLVCNTSPYSHFFYLSSAFSEIKIHFRDFCAATWHISFAGTLTVMLLQILV